MNRFSVSATENYPEWSLLLTWVAVVEAASVSGAARLLGLSQAAVSPVSYTHLTLPTKA